MIILGMVKENKRCISSYNSDDNDGIDVIAFGDEPTFVEEFGTFTANLPSEIKFCLPFFSSPTIF